LLLSLHSTLSNGLNDFECFHENYYLCEQI
jgi:hypothetical protein